MWLRIQSIATEKGAGARMQPCLTPDVVWKRLDRLFPLRTWAPMFSCKATMRSIRIPGTPVLRSSFHRARRSTESKAALMSRYATFSGRSTSQWSSDKRRRARMASIVERPVVKPDWCGLRVLSRSGWIRAKRTWENTLPGTGIRERTETKQLKLYWNCFMHVLGLLQAYSIHIRHCH